MIFVDTGAWFASVVPTDPDHQAASHWFRRNREPLITTDYVVDEILTLLRARRHMQRAITLGNQLFSGRLATVYYLDEQDIASAWDVFRAFTDKEWSFTDCTSKIVIARLGLTHAFAFDSHFHQFGSVTVLP